MDKEVVMNAIHPGAHARRADGCRFQSPRTTGGPATVKKNSS